MIPHSLADIEDEVVRTVQSKIMTDRGVVVKQDLQVLAFYYPASVDSQIHHPRTR